MKSAKEIGQTIGKAYPIEEEVPQRGDSSANFMPNGTLTVDSDSADTEGTLSLGQIKISARVIVRFESQLIRGSIGWVHGDSKCRDNSAP